MSTPPNPIKEASQYTTNGSSAFGKVKTGADVNLFFNS
jgi:hypothetical protein